MSDSGTVIGQGTYGCAHDPALICKGEATSRDDHISKILSNQDSMKELHEYVVISEVDPAKQFHLGTPTSCVIDDNDFNWKSIDKCRMNKDVFDNPLSYSLLIMKHGGVSLADFSRELRRMHYSPQNQVTVEKFWLEAHRMLLGVKAFLSKGIIHRDLKAANIVYKYDSSTQRLNFIDFGLTTSVSKMILQSRESRNTMTPFHWSYPLECGYLNKTRYDEYSRKTVKEREAHVRILLSNISVSTLTSSSLDKAIKIFCSYVSCENSSIRSCMKPLRQIMDDFVATLFTHIQPGDDKYEAFLRKSVNTFDSYGLGIAYMEVLRSCSHLIDPQFAQELNELFYHMYHPNIGLRYEIDEIIAKYEECLSSNAILAKYNKRFVDHVLVDGPEIPASIEKLIERVDPKAVKMSRAELRKHAGSAVIDCPEGTEYKASTGNCVKKCLPGYERNEAFRCIKTRQQPDSKTRRGSSKATNSLRSTRRYSQFMSLL